MSCLPERSRNNCTLVGGEAVITQCSTLSESRITGICACRLPAQTTSKPHGTTVGAVLLSLFIDDSFDFEISLRPEWDNMHVWLWWEGPHSEWPFSHSDAGVWMPWWWPRMLFYLPGGCNFCLDLCLISFNCFPHQATASSLTGRTPYFMYFKVSHICSYFCTSNTRTSVFVLFFCQILFFPP